MTKLKTVHSYKFGQTNIIPFLGATQISHEGIIEVEDENIAKKLVELEIGWEVVDKTITTTTTIESTTTTTTIEEITTTTTVDVIQKVEVDTLNKAVGEEAATTTTTTIVVSNEMLASIDELTVPELQNLAKPFPKKEWSSLNKPDLQAYLKSKLA